MLWELCALCGVVPYGAPVSFLVLACEVAGDAFSVDDSLGSVACFVSDDDVACGCACVFALFPCCAGFCFGVFFNVLRVVGVVGLFGEHEDVLVGWCADVVGVWWFVFGVVPDDV